MEPSNYLELRHKAPPAVLSREDQDYAYTKEGVLEASNKRAELGRERIDLARFQTSIYENSAAAPFRPTLVYLGQRYSNLDGYFCDILAFSVRRSVHSSELVNTDRARNECSKPIWPWYLHSNDSQC